MVKLAKKKKSKKLTKTKIEQTLPKTGVVNVNQIADRLEPGLSVEAVLLLLGLNAISDKDNKIELHDEEMRLIGSLISSMIDDGFLDLDEFRKAFKHYDNLLHVMFNCSKVEWRKQRKFGEPPFPTLEQLGQGLKINEIADRMGVQRRTIHTWLQDYEL